MCELCNLFQKIYNGLGNRDNYIYQGNRHSKTQNLKMIPMKRIMIMILAVTSLAHIVSAQDNNTDLRNKIMFGLKAGANFSNVYDIKGEGFIADP